METMPILWKGTTSVVPGSPLVEFPPYQVNLYTASNYISWGTGGLSLLKAGYYRINFHVYLSASFNTHFTLAVFKNGTKINGSLYTLGYMGQTISIDVIVQAFAGDQVRIVGELLSSAYLSYLDPTYSKLEIIWMGPLQ